jgi:membrane complex biogenesis BtpA family protein
MHFPPQPPLIGMVHLPALPGSPAHRVNLDQIIRHAVADARTMAQAGFAAVMVENFGDAPFHGGSIEPVTIASMAIVVRAVVGETGMLVGVNCLRNDARAALGVAAATGAGFIRVNVHTGVAATDQGILEGRAAETIRTKTALCPDVRLLADVHVKHAVPMSQPDIALAAEETVHRGFADAVIVSGPTTGRPPETEELARVKQAVPDSPVLVGSGATPETIQEILRVADGAIVGSCLKPEGDLSKPVDGKRAEAFVRAARR